MEEKLIIRATQAAIETGYNMLIANCRILFETLNQQIEYSKDMVKFVNFVTKEAK